VTIGSLSLTRDGAPPSSSYLSPLSFLSPFVFFLSLSFSLWFFFFFFPPFANVPIFYGELWQPGEQKIDSRHPMLAGQPAGRSERR